MRMHKSYALAFALVLLPAFADAQERVERSGRAAADGTVDIENIAGEIRVQAWDRNEVSLVAELGRGLSADNVEFSANGSRTHIEIDYPRQGRNIGGANLLVRVPAGSRVHATGVSARIVVEGVRGAVEAESVSGDVTVSGDTRTVKAASVSGDVDVRAPTTDLRAESVSGDVSAAQASGFIEAETTSGNIMIRGARATTVSLHSVSGNVAFAGSLDPNASVDMESFSGTVDLAVPGDTRADFDASTFSGSIQNGFSDHRPRTERRGPGSELEFSTGARGAQIELSSFSGTIRIRRQ